MRRLALLAAATVLAGVAACGSGATPVPPDPSDPPDTSEALPAPSPTAVATSAPVRPDALAFFRAQQAECRRHAEATAGPPVEPDRFARARVVRDLDDGGTLIEDGRGTKLVVEVAQGIVLPESGEPTDVMPVPYGFGCSEKIFVGASPD